MTNGGDAHSRFAQARNDTISEKPRGDGPSRFAYQKLDVAATKARASESLVRSPSVPVAERLVLTQAYPVSFVHSTRSRLPLLAD